MIIPPGFATIVPYLSADDADGYVRFLKEGLGGVEVGRNVQGGRILNCQVRFGDITIMVSEATAQYPAGHAALYFFVEDADAAVARAVQHGARLESEVGDRPYGDRQGGIVDPAGHIWWISQRLTAEPYFSEEKTA